MEYKIEVMLDSEKKNAIKYIGEGHTIYLLKTKMRVAFGSDNWPKRIWVSVVRAAPGGTIP